MAKEQINISFTLKNGKLAAVKEIVEPYEGKTTQEKIFDYLEKTILGQYNIRKLRKAKKNAEITARANLITDFK